jgi:hypothetical protein
VNEEERNLFIRMVTSIEPPVIGRSDVPAITVGLGPDAFSLRGHAYELLEVLSGLLAAAALKDRGLSHDEARETLLRSCFIAKRDGPDAALRHLEASLDRPPREWLVMRPLRAPLPGEPISIGACIIRQGIPEDLGFGENWLGAEDFPALTIGASVTARDDDTAALIAEQRFGEAIGLLHTFDPEGAPTIGEARAIVNDEGALSVNPDPRRAFHLDGFIGKGGELPSRLVPASAAAAKSMDSRTDWERRVIAASRWFSTGMASNWPSEKLVSLFIALEALFVAGKAESGNKKGFIADRITQRLQIEGRTPENQRSWIISLYDHRNDAVHEARDYLDDFEVADLGLLVRRTLHWAMDHLVVEHRRDGQACTTFDEVMSCKFGQ